jgi:3-methyladenine DNA glycosylase AlkD
LRQADTASKAGRPGDTTKIGNTTKTGHTAKTAGSTPSRDAISAYVQKELQALVNPVKAKEMAAYMRTEMPFYGVQKPDRLPIIKSLKADFAPQSRKEYEHNILALWKGRHREEKYMAINYAGLFKQYMTPDSVPVYEKLIREGQWWDFIDSIAGDLLAPILVQYPDQMRPLIDAFSSDHNFWVRRSAILSHLPHKKQTSHKHLFAYCKAMAHEDEFFIRKAIGWALREYSKHEPERVLAFLRKNKGTLSNLSMREGSKYLVKTGVIAGVDDI